MGVDRSSGLLPKMLRLSESLGAAATAIWSVVRVHSQVLAEVVFGCETLLAVVAVEGSLTSVSSFMNLQSINKSIRTSS